jgi:hypothetical protein
MLIQAGKLVGKTEDEISFVIQKYDSMSFFPADPITFALSIEL